MPGTKMNLTDNVKTWQAWLATGLLTVGALSGTWAFLHTEFVPQAQAAEDRKSIIRKWIAEAEYNIQKLQDEITEITYGRPDLSQRAKAELIGVRQRQIAKLEATLSCLRQDRLDC